MTSLSVSIVVYRSDPAWFDRTLRSLALALDAVTQDRSLSRVQVIVVDNDTDDVTRTAIAARAREVFGTHERISTRIIAGQGNVGFGRAHNMALRESDSDFHLALNPDVEIAPNALTVGLPFLVATPQAGFVSPCAFRPDGRRQYLAKAYPNVCLLALRACGLADALAPAAHAAYERRELDLAASPQPIAMAGGCFLLARTAFWRQLGGFDEGYFLYFEDTDLTLRASRIATNFFVPAMRIVHAGGDAARKGMRHQWLFVHSAWRFFSIHGWRWW